MVFTSTVSPVLETGLRFIGLWPNVPYTAVKQLIYMSASLFLDYFQCISIISYCKFGNVQSLVDILPVIAYYNATIVKLMILWMNRRKFCEIVVSMDMDWRECVNVDRHFQFMTTKARIAHLCSNVMFKGNIFVGGLYLISDNVIEILQQLSGNYNTSRPLPVTVEFPFETEQSPIHELTVIILFLHGMVNVYTNVIVNMTVFTLVLHAIGQIEIICEEMKSISKEMTYHGSSKHTIKILVERHHKVITFSENIDKLYSFIALAQIFLDTVVLCILGLLIVISTNETAILVKIIFAWISVIVEIFVLCFAGEYLCLKSKLLAEAAYDSLWYNMSYKQSKDLLFIIMRCQKPMTMKAGGVKDLSLEAFASIMKASASYMSVLHAMY